MRFGWKVWFIKRLKCELRGFPHFIGLHLNNDRILNFTGEKKTLNVIYNKLKKLKTIKMGQDDIS